MIISLYYLKPEYEEFFRLSYDQIVNETNKNPLKQYYYKTFTGEVADDLDLEGLFSILTNDMPESFVGHDFGVSDVVEIVKSGDKLKAGNYYYCDIIGWDKLSAWESKKEELLEDDDSSSERAEMDYRQRVDSVYKSIDTSTHTWDFDDFMSAIRKLGDVE